MSRKSKKLKKPQPREVKVLSAHEIENYIRIKFDTEDDDFWAWFFSECSWGKTNLLGLADDDINMISNKFKTYYNIIKSEFLPDANEDGNLEINNDR